MSQSIPPTADWRSALRFLATQAVTHNIDFTVSGGAVFALHGIPVPVRDLDLITDHAGASRFGEIFAAQAVEPVAYRVSERYRSHFGRFVVQDIPVDVMAELEWREGERWQPIFAATRSDVDLDGVLVVSAWPEEEFLAAIRRGRLERAAAVLPHLDHARLLCLLRGEVKAGML